VVWDNGKEFAGSTPTAPYALLALFIGSMEVTSGIQVSSHLASIIWNGQQNDMLMPLVGSGLTWQAGFLLDILL
jgi:hypothetical protein